MVVRAERPTSGKPGDKAIITADGTLYGWIGGNCAQPSVVREALRAMRAPAGIDIGARRGDEIALSIMAEIVAFRHGREQNTAMQPSPRRTEHKQPEIAIDPVCGMEVAITGAQHHYLLEDPNYYFCCPGCRGWFIKNPQRFLSAVHDPTN